MCEHMREDTVMYQASSVRNVTKHLNGVRNVNVTWTIIVNKRRNSQLYRAMYCVLV